MELETKLEILSGAAKYDVSCASSGSIRKNEPGGIGSCARAANGICHSWSDDGRCISLLKLLMTNDCIYNCAYCVNRSSSDVPRASFTPDEVVSLTMSFYRRNYIEGLFLSSAVYKSPDYTMELMLQIIRKLREECRFNGYIHLKVIPGADFRLIYEAGRLADRLSVNIELPTSESLKLLAPQKKKEAIIKPMSFISSRITQAREENMLFRNSSLFVPAGQSTQLIVGATPDHDLSILRLSESLYKSFRMKRVYYSAYVPVSSHPNLPAIARPPLLREHRLYQADWLLRFYGFTSSELLDERHPDFDTELDPKSDWAVRNFSLFPIEVNRANYDMLIRIPGIGVKSAKRIISARRICPLSYDDLKKIGVVLKRARYFITCKGKYFAEACSTDTLVRQALVLKSNEKYKSLSSWEQLSLFPLLRDLPTAEDQVLSLTGEL